MGTSTMGWTDITGDDDRAHWSCSLELFTGVVHWSCSLELTELFTAAHSSSLEQLAGVDRDHILQLSLRTRLSHK